VVRELSNMSELGLVCSCSLTSPLAMSESYLSMSDAQLLCLLALGGNRSGGLHGLLWEGGVYVSCWAGLVQGHLCW